MSRSKETSREKKVLIIADELTQGKKPVDFMKRYMKLWKMSSRSVERIMAEAGPIADKRFKEQQEITDRVRKEEIEKAAKDSILSDIEVEALLCNIIKGQLFPKTFMTSRGAVVVKSHPDAADKLKAAYLLFKKRGSYSAIKLEHDIEVVTVAKTPFSIKKRSANTGGK